MIEFFAYKTRHGWVVAAGAVRGDDGPTFFTERGADDLADKLNALKVDVASSAPQDPS